jgi:hypothetical protein
MTSDKRSCGGGGGDEDILDNVSDISEGDIPELPEAEGEEGEEAAVMDQEMEDQPQQQLIDGANPEEAAAANGSDAACSRTVAAAAGVATNGHDSSLSTATAVTATTVVAATAVRSNFVVREDIEEISDEEAEWSDDIETAGYSDFETMGDGGEDGDSAATAASLIRIVDVVAQTATSELRQLAALRSPTETLYACVSRGKTVSSTRESLLSADAFVITREAAGSSSLPDLLARLAAAGTSIDERWVDNLEALTVVLQEELALLGSSGNDEAAARSALVQVALAGLDYKVAVAQPKPAYQIRHVKAGLRFLLEALSCDEATFGALIEAGVQARLLELYRQPFMTIPTRLLVLRVMERTLDRTSGIEAALTAATMPHYSGSIYEQLLDLLQEETKTRIKFSITSTLNKFHLYEMMMRLAELTDASEEILGDVVGGGGDLKEMEGLLRQIGEAYTSRASFLAHPVRFLPCSQHWDLETGAAAAASATAEDSRPERSFFLLADQAGLLAVLVALLTGRRTAASEAVAAAVHDLLALWLETEAGLLYVAAGGQVTSSLVRAMATTTGRVPAIPPYHASEQHDTEPPTEAAMDLSSSSDTNTRTVPSLSSSAATTTTPFMMTASIGPELATMVLAVQQLDLLMAAVRTAGERQELESRSVLEAVQILYGLTFTGRGKRAVVHVLTLGRHMDALLALIRHSSPEGPKDMKKSAARGYANELLLLTVRSTDNIEFWTRYKRLFIIIKVSVSDLNTGFSITVHTSNVASYLVPLVLPLYRTSTGI